MAFAATLIVAIACVGFIAVRTSRATLLDQVDQDLDAIAQRMSTRPTTPPASEALRPNSDADTARTSAFLAFDASGEVIVSLPSGFGDDPDPLPAASEVGDLLGQPGLKATVFSSDGTIEYRVIAADSGDGTVVGAIAIDYINDATDQLIERLILMGIIIAAVGTLLTLWSVRRGLQPVDAMVDTASAIAAGDLTQRVPEHQPESELGQLGTALNNMLGQIDTAFAQEQRSQTQLNQFIADASHELRTPLATIQGLRGHASPGCAQRTGAHG